MHVRVLYSKTDVSKISVSHGHRIVNIILAFLKDLKMGSSFADVRYLARSIMFRSLLFT